MLLPHLIDKLNIDKLNEIDKFQVLNENIVKNFIQQKILSKMHNILKIYI